MSVTATLRFVGVTGAVLCLLPAAPAGAAGLPERDANASAAPQAVSLSLDAFVRIVLINHPDLKVASGPAGADPNEQSPPARTGELVVWGSTAPGVSGQIALRRRVNDVLFQAVEAYWEQFRRLEDVALRREALDLADETLRAASRPAGPDASALPRRTAETRLAELRIALHRSRHEAALGEDRLKLMMNDETLRVDTPTRIELSDQPPTPPAGEGFDLDDGIRRALRNRLPGRIDRADLARRRTAESIALEVKTALRRLGDAREMFLLAGRRSEAAEKALAAARRDEETGRPVPAGHVLARIRAADALADGRRQLLTARTDYQVALAAWFRAVGELHEQWHVVVRPRD